MRLIWKFLGGCGAVCLPVLLMLHVGIAGAAPARKYVLAVHSTSGGVLNATLKSQFEAYAKQMKAQTGVDLTVRVITYRAELMKAVAKGEFDFIGTLSEDMFIRALNTGKYDVMMSYNLFNKPKHEYCLYVAVASPYKSAAALRGKSAMTYVDEYAYIVFKDILGEPPLNFFNRLTGTGSGVSAAYALSLKQVDAALVHSLSIGQLKQVNPGPLKKIKPLACAPAEKPPALLYAKKVPPDIRAWMVKEISSIHKNPAYKEFHPLMKQLQMTFHPAVIQEYREMISRFNKTQPQSFLKVYRQWEAQQKVN